MPAAESHFVEVPPGPPIGVTQTARYEPLTVELPTRASLLAYTDGLVERRGELLDTGMERLRALVSAAQGGADQLLDAVGGSLAGEVVTDDVALLALHWTG